MKNQIIVPIFIISVILFLVSCSGMSSHEAQIAGDVESSKMADEQDRTSVEGAEEEQPDLEKDSKTWQRSQKESNGVALFIGDNEEIPLKGSQISVKIDGFRARILIDCFFYNSYKFQAEGNFKIRLPQGASPYFFAFGETVLLDQNKPEVSFNNYDEQGELFLSPDQIIERRSKDWSNPKEARVVEKEKAALAYSQTISRSIDPALAEWGGSDIFNCRVFPLVPGKMHRIIIGYDVNLTEIGNDRVFTLDIPKTESTKIVNFDIAQIRNSEIKTEPELNLNSGKTSKTGSLTNPQQDEISIRYKNTKPIILTCEKTSEEKYFACPIKIDLPANATSNVSENAVIALDVSASSNPDKFNIWLKMLEAILSNNQGTINKFNVIFFNIENFWWKPEPQNNSPENIKTLLDFCNTLSLEGASDMSAVLHEINTYQGFSGKEKNIFMLSDASVSWGEDELYSISSEIKDKSRIYSFNTGVSGSDRNVMEHLARETGGAVFSIPGEDQVVAASKSFLSKAWKLLSVNMSNCTDINIAGRPKYIYPGQNIIVSGRGNPDINSKLILELEQNGKTKKLQISFNDVLESELTKRIYGQTAVNILESFDYLTEKMSVAYAEHFAIPGNTCSLLMLETEEDYKQYNINVQENLFVIKENPVSSIVSETLAKMSEFLGSSKATFLNSLNKLSKTVGVVFQIPTSMEILLKKMPEEDFKVIPKKLECKQHTRNNNPEELSGEIQKSKPDYDIISKFSLERKQKFGEADALKLLSTLVERNPGDGVMARDVAYSAMEWGLSEQAYYLFKRVIKARPYEPQTYHAIAQILTKMNYIDLAVIYYETALSAKWDDRFGEFNEIATLDYVYLLQQISQGKYKVSFPEYTSERLKNLSKNFGNNDSDLIITISWNTDFTDIDLHVTEPSGEECYYEYPDTKSGGHLTKDVTQGYGPEMYVMNKAKKGKYIVKAKYFSTDRNRASTRTKVYAVIYENRGKSNEKITKKVVTLEDNKEMHDIIEIDF